MLRCSFVNLYDLYDNKNKKEITCFKIQFITLFIVSIVFLLGIINEKAPPVVKDGSKVLFYGKPQSAALIGGALIIISPFFSVILCKKISKIKHKKIVFYIFQIFFIVCALVSIHKSYYVITENKIYFGYLNKTEEYSLKNVTEINIECKADKRGKQLADVTVYVNNSNTIKLEYNINKKNFLEFNEGCVNAKKKC